MCVERLRPARGVRAAIEPQRGREGGRVRMGSGTCVDGRRAQRAPGGGGEARSRRAACRRRRRPSCRVRGPARGRESSRRRPLTALGLAAARSNHAAADRSTSPRRLPVPTPSTPSHVPKAGDVLGAAKCAAAAARGSAAAREGCSPATPHTGKKTRAARTLPTCCPCVRATRTCVHSSKRGEEGARDGRLARGGDPRGVVVSV